MASPVAMGLQKRNDFLVTLEHGCCYFLSAMWCSKMSIVRGCLLCALVTAGCGCATEARLPKTAPENDSIDVVGLFDALHSLLVEKNPKRKDGHFPKVVQASLDAFDFGQVQIEFRELRSPHWVAFVPWTETPCFVINTGVTEIEEMAPEWRFLDEQEASFNDADQFLFLFWLLHEAVYLYQYFEDYKADLDGYLTASPHELAQFAVLGEAHLANIFCVAQEQKLCSSYFFTPLRMIVNAYSSPGSSTEQGEALLTKLLTSRYGHRAFGDSLNAMVGGSTVGKVVRQNMLGPDADDGIPVDDWCAEFDDFLGVLFGKTGFAGNADFSKDSKNKKWLAFKHFGLPASKVFMEAYQAHLTDCSGRNTSEQTIEKWQELHEKALTW